MRRRTPGENTAITRLQPGEQRLNSGAMAHHKRLDPCVQPPMLNAPEHVMKFALLVFSSALAVQAAQPLLVHTFQKQTLTKEFWSEGATFGDFNHDGVNDIAAGPFWYAGPKFEKRHEFYPATQSFMTTNSTGKVETIAGFEGALGKKNTYSKNFLMFTYDFNSDGWPDIMVVGFPGEDTSWYENPKGREGHWQKHVMLEVTDNESPGFGDVTGDGKPELFCNSGGYFVYAEADWKDASRPWKMHKITPKGPWQKFTHGIGIGDVNGDGKMDFLEADGWWEQPASLAGEPEWKKHPFKFSTGGSQMYAYDFDGDGDNDVVTELAAHGFGLAWYENVKENGEITFKPHVIMNKEPKENRYGVKFSQLHSMDLVDMDGDGIKDIVTGKRFWAHGLDGDVEPNAPAVVYWFKTMRHGGSGNVDFVPYLIDDDSGVGTQVMAGRVDKDEFPDVVVGNKKGVFVFHHTAKKVSKKEWAKHQPTPISK
jgi:hypothetical protein